MNILIIGTILPTLSLTRDEILSLVFVVNLPVLKWFELANITVTPIKLHKIKVQIYTFNKFIRRSS